MFCMYVFFLFPIFILSFSIFLFILHINTKLFSVVDIQSFTGTQKSIIQILFVFFFFYWIEIKILTHIWHIFFAFLPLNLLFSMPFHRIFFFCFYVYVSLCQTVYQFFFVWLCILCFQRKNKSPKMECNPYKHTYLYIQTFTSNSILKKKKIFTYGIFQIR